MAMTEMGDKNRKDQAKLSGLVKFALKVKEQRLRKEEFRVNKFKIRFAKELNQTFKHLGVNVDVSKLKQEGLNLKLKRKGEFTTNLENAGAQMSTNRHIVGSLVKHEDFSLTNHRKKSKLSPRLL